MENMEARFRARMRGLRSAQGISQTGLGERANLDRSVISKIETAYRGLSLNEAAAIARALGYTLEEMISEAPLQVSVEVS